MRIGEIDIPAELIDAQESNCLVIFAGAGVSVPSPSNYPNFRELADTLGRGLPRETSEPDDRYLGRLHASGVRVHERVQRLLTNPDSNPNVLHHSLLKLFRDGASTRLVTTNFDNHFSNEAKVIFTEFTPEMFSAPALPVGDNFIGIVSLHGSVDKSAERMILTDADFGRAYLTEGWARRFLQRVFAKYTVLFVGYSHDDPIVTYLARGLPPKQLNGPQRFAFVLEDAVEKWKFLGVTPITYQRRDGGKPHGALEECLINWSKRARESILEQEAKIKDIVEGPIPVEVEKLDYLDRCTSALPTVRFFTRFAKSTDWLDWIQEKQHFKALFRPYAAFDQVHQELSLWFAQIFACLHPDKALAVVRANGGSMHPALATSIAQAVFAGTPDPQVIDKWVPVLIQQRSSGADHLLNYVMDKCVLPQHDATLLSLFDYLTEPLVELEKDLWASMQDPPQDRVSATLHTRGEEYWLRKVWKAHLEPSVPRLYEPLFHIVTANLLRAYRYLSSYGKITEHFDPISSRRGLLENSSQGDHRSGVGVLIDAARAMVEWATEVGNGRFRIEQLFALEWLLFRRLALYGLARSTQFTSDEKIGFLLEHDCLFFFGLKREVFQVLAAAYGSASTLMRKAVLDEVDSYGSHSEQHVAYQVYNILNWLSQHAPQCDIARRKLDESRAANPHFGPREHPDMDSWIGPVTNRQFTSPRSAEELIKMSPPEAIAYIRDFKSEEPFGDTKEGLLGQVAAAVSKSPSWGFSVADTLASDTTPSADIWLAVAEGWKQIHLSVEEWDKVVSLLEPNPTLLHSLRNGVPNLLENTSKQSPGLSEATLPKAVSLSFATWDAIRVPDEGARDSAADWLQVAINSPGGILAEFWLHALSLERKFAGSDWRGLPENWRKHLDRVIADTSAQSELARVVIASHVHFLFDLDREWAVSTVVPLFNWSAPKQALQAWHGYLTWGRWNDELLHHLMKYFEATFAHLAELSECRRSFCEYLGSIAVLSNIDPLSSGWLERFLQAASIEDRVTFASEIGVALKRANADARHAAWLGWIEAYWSNRQDGIPVPLEGKETSEFSDWVLVFGPDFPAAVERLRQLPAPELQYGFIFHDLHETDLPDTFPDNCAKFILYLLSGNVGPIYDLDPLIKSVRRVVRSGAAKPAVHAICEQLAALGVPNARRLIDEE